MIRRLWLVCTGLLWLTLRVAGAERPNIVFVLADDLGWGDPHCYNADSRIPTPHIDRLAREGMRFTDMHTPSAVCTPTRYGLLTGRYAWRSRLKSGVLWGWSPPLIETNRLTLPAMLRQRGYTTGGFGKWHLGLGWVTRQPVTFGDQRTPGADVKQVDYSQPLWGGPRTAGFDEYFGIPASLDMEPYVWINGDRCVEAPTFWTEGGTSQRSGGNGFYRAGPMAPGFHVGEVLPAITGAAISFMERQVSNSRTKPFFAYVPLTSPHDPWLPHTSYWGRSAAGARGDFVAQTDACVGQILDALDRLGLADSTLVVFTSDNGAHWIPADIQQTGHRANGPWRGQKSDIHEAGHRVPCVVRWPSVVPAGKSLDQMVCQVDWMATFAEITGTRLPKGAGEDSVSFAPALRGKAMGKAARHSLVLHSGNGVFALRQGAWKWIEGLGSGGFTAPASIQPLPGGPVGQLYNLGSDPSETRDLSEVEPERVAAMRAELERLRRLDTRHAATP